jgi:uncharacterized protein YndB with AHSA1/START domain
VKLVDRVVHIDAEVEDVYALLIDADRFVALMAPTATLDPPPGGVITWTHRNGDVVSGHYVEVVPNRRVVFTFGWERADVEIPPGSTTVEIDLRSTADGTELRLVHRGLPGPMADAHAGGWDNYLRRLADVAAGTTPVPTCWPPNAFRRPSRSGSHEHRNHIGRSPVLGARPTTARPGGRYPLNDDGIPLPSLARRLLRHLRPAHRRPCRQTRRREGDPTG